MGWIVKHQNPKVIRHNSYGRSWAIDGAGQDWTKAEAEAHAKKCEYTSRHIPFEIVEETAPIIQKSAASKGTVPPT